MIFTKEYKAVNWEYNLKVYISLKLSIYLIDIINDKTHYLNKCKFKCSAKNEQVLYHS